MELLNGFVIEIPSKQFFHLPKMLDRDDDLCKVSCAIIFWTHPGSSPASSIKVAKVCHVSYNLRSASPAFRSAGFQTCWFIESGNTPPPSTTLFWFISFKGHEVPVLLSWSSSWYQLNDIFIEFRKGSNYGKEGLYGSVSMFGSIDTM